MKAQKPKGRRGDNSGWIEWTSEYVWIRKYLIYSTRFLTQRFFEVPIESFGWRKLEGLDSAKWASILKPPRTGGYMSGYHPNGHTGQEYICLSIFRRFSTWTGRIQMSGSEIVSSSPRRFMSATMANWSKTVTCKGVLARIRASSIW